MKIFSKVTYLLPVKFLPKGSPLIATELSLLSDLLNLYDPGDRKHGALLGLLMGCARILRCNPFVRGGYDPVGDHFSLRRNKNPKK